MTDQHPAVAFLLAAHQRAEETARAAIAESGPEWVDNGESVYLKDSNEPVAVGPWDCPISDGARGHIALHDPRAVLRRVAAERKTLAEHQAVGDPRWPECGRCGDNPGEAEIGEGMTVRTADAVDFPCRTVLNLAEAWGWQPNSPATTLDGT